MRNPGGQAIIIGNDGIVNFDGVRCEEIQGDYTADTFTCFHCNRIEHVPHKPDVNHVGFCRNCMKPICQRCSDLPCVPFEKKLEMAERKAAFRRTLEAG